MKKNNTTSALILLFISFLFIEACTKEADNTNEINSSDIALLPKKYDSACFLMTHNSMNCSEKSYAVPNQTYSISNQLNAGVRGLMLDTYDGADGVALTYHAIEALGSQKLVDVLQEVKAYLQQNTNAIISIIFQNEGGNTQLEQAIDSIGLDAYTYTHTAGTAWPTIQNMVNNNQRLVLFVEKNKLPRANYLMNAFSIIFDTKYEFSNVNQFNADLNRGTSGSKELYLVNHWLSGLLGLPDKNLAPQANARAVVGKRVQDCSTTNNHFINFLGVDFVEIGDAKAVVDSINAAH